MSKIMIKNCIVCGTQFETDVHSKKTCSAECARLRRNMTMSRRERELREIKKKEKAIRKETLSDVNAKAKAIGLSYGEYVARYC